MSAFTPGPWQVELYREGGFNIEKEGGGHAGGVLVLCGRNPFPRLEAQSHANARLISAAPDLLAAAVQAEKWIAVQMADNGWPAERLINPPEGSHLFNLRAAIAKAVQP